jgi:hypothetical protein
MMHLCESFVFADPHSGRVIRRATRRKLEKDPNAATGDGDGQDRQTPCDESKHYLETTIFECVAPEYKLREIVDRPEGVDYNEWIAFNSMSSPTHCLIL